MTASWVRCALEIPEPKGPFPWQGEMLRHFPSLAFVPGRKPSLSQWLGLVRDLERADQSSQSDARGWQEREAQGPSGCARQAAGTSTTASSLQTPPCVVATHSSRKGSSREGTR